MSTVLEINGISFLSIKEAAALVAYSKDYVSRLAREQKIVATQVGRQWYVDPVSLRSFAEMARLEQEVRKQQLSAERRREQAVKREVVVAKSSTHDRVRKRLSRAKVAASFILFVGLSFGTFGYFYNGSVLVATDFINSDVTAGLSFGERSASEKATEEAVSLHVPKAEPVAIYSTVVDRPKFENYSEVSSLTASSASGILLLTEDGREVSEVSVNEIFSDDVEVRFTGPSGGVVVYEGEAGEMREFPFVSVPSADSNASSTVVF